MDFSALFTSDDSFCHLNAGTRTRVPLAVLEFMERERRESERNPTKAMFTGYDRIWKVQRSLAAFLGAFPEDIFLRSNVTSAFNDFLFALPVAPPGELVATGWEYGGTVGLARHWAKVNGLGFRLAPLELRGDLAPESLVAEVLAALRPESRLLLLSHVATGTGAVLPVAEIAREARKRGVIVIVDGAHAVGALPVDLAAMDAVDFYGGNFHKWFLGPEGTGFGWVNPRWRGRLEWKFGGWASETPPAFYQGFGGGNAEICRRFFPGTIDRVPFLGLGETLRFWEKYGPGAIRERQGALLDLVIAEAEGLGWKLRSPSRASRLLGPLAAFDRPAEWVGEPTALATRIYREAKVQLALPTLQELPLVRFSPGVYARESEIRSAFESLRRWKP